jgi:hypothetical protein
MQQSLLYAAAGLQGRTRGAQSKPPPGACGRQPSRVAIALRPGFDELELPDVDGPSSRKALGVQARLKRARPPARGSVVETKSTPMSEMRWEGLRDAGSVGVGADPRCVLELAPA